MNKPRKRIQTAEDVSVTECISDRKEWAAQESPEGLPPRPLVIDYVRGVPVCDFQKAIAFIEALTRRATETKIELKLLKEKYNCQT